MDEGGADGDCPKGDHHASEPYAAEMLQRQVGGNFASYVLTAVSDAI